jgi:hypothetical protein
MAKVKKPCPHNLDHPVQPLRLPVLLEGLEQVGLGACIVHEDDLLQHVLGRPVQDGIAAPEQGGIVLKGRGVIVVSNLGVKPRRGRAK